MAWECDRCKTLHTQNPDECRSCGHKIFRPVPDAELRRRSTSGTAPEGKTVNSDQVTGTARKPDYETSPDVAVDGSIAGGDKRGTSASESKTPAGPGWLRSAYYSVRGAVRAPFALLREYFIPILAFLLVFGAVAYLLFS